MGTPLEKIELFQGLTPAELQTIRGYVKEKAFKKGEILFSEGQCCERVFIVQTGRVKLYRTASSGREQILEMLEPGDTCACNPGSRTWSCMSTAEAATPCAVWFLSRDDYLKMVASNEKISHSLNQLFAKRIQNLSTLVEEVSLKDVKKRLVKFLLDMRSQKKGKSETLFIPFTREEIAQRLGTARETVARHLHELKEEKLIDVKPYQIIILSPEGLQKLLR